MHDVFSNSGVPCSRPFKIISTDGLPKQQWAAPKFIVAYALLRACVVPQAFLPVFRSLYICRQPNAARKGGGRPEGLVPPHGSPWGQPFWAAAALSGGGDRFQPSQCRHSPVVPQNRHSPQPHFYRTLT